MSLPHFIHESLDDILLALEGLTPEEAQRLLDEAGGTS